MFGKRLTGAVVILAIAGSALAGWAYWHHQRYKHVAVHEPGMMYRSAWLEPDVMAELIERWQIRTVVNLCEPGEMGEQRWQEERDAVRNAGARLAELPMPVIIEATDDPQIDKHVELLNDPNNYPMLVHCQHGVTRTAKFLAIYDIAYRGKTADETFQAQPKWGRDDHNVHVKAFVRSFEKAHKELYPTAGAQRLDVLRQ